MGMHELMRVEESGAESMLGWLKAIAWSALIAWAVFFTFDTIDSMWNSSPSFVVKQWVRHIAGSRTEGENEAKALLALAAREAQLPGLAHARIWVSDGLRDTGNIGFFNPIVYKITLSEKFAETASYDQRWLVFHEAGHAAQLLTTRFDPIALPEWGLSPEAERALSTSMLYRQAYSESFADVFALAMSSRLDPSDPRVSMELALAKARGVDSVSLSHDTQAALSIASGRLVELASWRGRDLLALIDMIASRGAARTVGEWGAEREALCMQGVWGWSRWARDGAHQVASNPWSMASAQAPRVGEPRASEIAQIMALTPNRGWKRARLERGWTSYARRSAELGELSGEAQLGWVAMSGAESRDGESHSGYATQEEAWGKALANYEPKSRNRLRALLEPPLAWMAARIEHERPWGCEVRLTR